MRSRLRLGFARAFVAALLVISFLSTDFASAGTLASTTLAQASFGRPQPGLRPQPPPAPLAANVQAERARLIEFARASGPPKRLNASRRMTTADVPSVNSSVLLAEVAAAYARILPQVNAGVPGGAPALHGLPLPPPLSPQIGTPWTPSPSSQNSSAMRRERPNVPRPMPMQTPRPYRMRPASVRAADPINTPVARESLTAPG